MAQAHDTDIQLPGIQYWPQERSASHQEPNRCSTNDCHILCIRIQPMFSPLNYPYFHYILHELPSENTVADGVRNLTEIKVYCMHHSFSFLTSMQKVIMSSTIFAFISPCWLFFTICLPRHPKFRQILRGCKITSCRNLLKLGQICHSLPKNGQIQTGSEHWEEIIKPWNV